MQQCQFTVTGTVTDTRWQIWTFEIKLSDLARVEKSWCTNFMAATLNPYLYRWAFSTYGKSSLFK
jgi:hypothetical protein